jgi:hypothetical protein
MKNDQEFVTFPVSTMGIMRLHKFQSLFDRNSEREIGARNGRNHRFIMIDIMNSDHSKSLMNFHWEMSENPEYSFSTGAE